MYDNVGGFEKRAEKERERDGKSERQFLVHVSGVSILIPGWGASSDVQFQIQTNATHTLGLGLHYAIIVQEKKCSWSLAVEVN